jgi:hypothetical protein
VARASVELGSTVLPKAMSGKLSVGKSPSGPAPRPVFFQPSVVLREEKKGSPGTTKTAFFGFPEILENCEADSGPAGSSPQALVMRFNWQCDPGSHSRPRSNQGFSV